MGLYIFGIILAAVACALCLYGYITEYAETGEHNMMMLCLGLINLFFFIYDLVSIQNL